MSNEPRGKHERKIESMMKASYSVIVIDNARLEHTFVRYSLLMLRWDAAMLLARQRATTRNFHIFKLQGGAMRLANQPHQPTASQQLSTAKVFHLNVVWNFPLLYH